MPNNQFVVPQFIEVESKIIGPISGRQFVILLIALGLSYVWFSVFTPVYIFLPLVTITMGTGAVLAFGKINGQAMHYFLLNLVQTMKRPRLKVWHRGDVPRKGKEKPEDLGPIQTTPKAGTSRSRLAEMSLMVDTGGIYQGQEMTYK